MGQTGLLWDVPTVLGTWDGKDSVIWAFKQTGRTIPGHPDCPLSGMHMIVLGCHKVDMS